MSDKLNKLLANARPATEAELRAQRESWVRGEMAIGLDRDEVKWEAGNMTSNSFPPSPIRRATNEGWTCPKCQSVWSPVVPGCFTCNKSVDKGAGKEIKP